MAMPADIKAHIRQLIAEFRAAGGQLPDRPLLLLTTTGARSGRPHTAPMMYVAEGADGADGADGDRLLVIASNAGAPAHPDWYHNLVANPAVTVEVAGETYDATATPLVGDERDRVFARIAEDFPFFKDHQAGVSRTIPVVALER
jgi:deazaflavin-dependent oxidoreductase (nitroreductase family)